MQCPKCGEDVREDANYCDNCGLSLDEYGIVRSEGESEVDPGSDQGQGNRSMRIRLIAAFVAFDIMLAAFLIYWLMNVE